MAPNSQNQDQVTDSASTKASVSKSKDMGEDKYRKWWGRLDPNFWYMDGVAYDFTTFADAHPGGKHAIYLGKGRDCSALFHSYHFKRLPDARILKKYRVADELQPDNTKDQFLPRRKFTFDNDGFYAVVKRRANKYFEERNMSINAPWTHVFMSLLWPVLQIISMYGVIVSTRADGLCLTALAWASLHALSRGLSIVQTVHAASHFSWSSWPMVNRWVYRIGTILIGLWSPGNWDVQHVVAHHVYTNEWPFDSDSGFPVKSVAGNQRRYWYHKYQHIYSWVLYALFIPIIMMNATREIVTGKQMTFKMLYHWPGQRYETYACIAGMWLYQVLPLLCVPFGNIWAVWFYCSVATSLFFSLQFVVNHETDEIHDSTTKTLPNARGETDWGAYQCDESFSFAPTSRLALELSGGLNTQIEHHLFPSVHYAHYAALSVITKKTAEEFGVPYRWSPSLLSAWKAHYNLLKNPPGGKHASGSSSSSSSKKDA